MQYSVILSHTHATQAFTGLEQGSDDILGNCLHHASDSYLKYTTLLTCLAFGRGP